MTVRFDASTGELVLDQAALETFFALGQGQQPEPSELQRLTDAGILSGGDIVAPLVDIVGALARPFAMLGVTVAESGRRLAHTAWLSFVTPFGLDEGPDTRIMPVASDLVPTVTARLMQLAPRERLADGRAVMAPADLGTFLSAERGDRVGVATRLAAALPAAWAEGAQALRDGNWRLTAIDVAWPDAAGGPEHLRGFLVLDVGAGLLAIDPDGESLVLTPTTPTDVWQWCIDLLPSDADLLGEQPDA